MIRSFLFFATATFLLIRPSAHAAYLSPESCRISYWSQKIGESEKKLAGHCSATLVKSDAFVTAAHCALSDDDIQKHHIVATTVSCPNSEHPEDRLEKKITIQLKQKPDTSLKGMTEGRDTEQDLMVARSESEFKTTPARLPDSASEEKELLTASPRNCFRAGFSSPDPTNLAGTFTIDDSFIATLNPIVGFSIGRTLIESTPRRYPGDSGGGLICIDAQGSHVLVGILHGTENKYGDSVTSERPSFAKEWLKYALSEDKPKDNQIFEKILTIEDYCTRAEGCLNSVGQNVAKLNQQMVTLLSKLNSEFHQTLNEAIEDRSLDAYKKKSDQFWNIFIHCRTQIEEKL